MKTIEKHQFEAVSLLTTQSGSLEVSIIPVENQPDWLVPSSLILAIEPMTERIWTYLWRGQDVSVYHLLEKLDTPEKIVVLEGNTSVHRLALQIKGDVRTLQVKISEVIDTELPKGFIDMGADSKVFASTISDDIAPNETASASDSELQLDENGIGVPFVFQAVDIAGTVYVVPDVDTIAHQLVDLDS